MSISRPSRVMTVVPSAPRTLAADELLGAAHAVGVVGVGLVPLDHGELGVVLERHALVAEVLAELVDALEAAHDQALEVQLGRHAQVEGAVELVVVRRERPRARAAVERLQDRRLDLDEADAVEVGAARGDHARAPQRVLAHVGVDHQVDVALAVARLDVGQAVVQIGQRVLAGREQLELLEPQRQLAAAARDGLARRRR